MPSSNMPHRSAGARTVSRFVSRTSGSHLTLESVRRFTACGLILLLSAAPGALGQTPIASAPGLPADCHCGVLAMRSGAVLVERSADRLFTPASVQKLIVAAAALHFLGPDFRVATEIYLPAPDAAETSRGDLVIVGRGDPTWNETHFEDDPRRPLRRIAEELRRRGVRHVEGDIVLDGRAFPGRETPPDWPVGDLAFRYGAVPSALGVDRNSVKLRMAPGKRIGDPVRATVSAPVRLLNRAVTASADLHGKGTVEFQVQWDQPQIVARGEFPLSEQAFRIEVAAPQPMELVAHELAKVLTDEGITWTGESRVVDGFSSEMELSGLSRSATPLLVLRSPPLREWLEPLLADSDNWVAEMLLRVLALETLGAGRLDLGLDLEADFLSEVVGLDSGGFDLDDASGLSPFNLLTPRTVVQLLHWALQQAWFPLFEAALASQDQGTLSRSWGRVPALFAKTGSLTHVQTLAGYDRSLPGPPTVFAVFSNARTGARSRMKRDILAEIRGWRPAARSAVLPQPDRIGAPE